MEEKYNSVEMLSKYCLELETEIDQLRRQNRELIRENIELVNIIPELGLKFENGK